MPSVLCRMSAEDHQAVKGAAKALGMTLQDFVALHVVDAARRATGEAAQDVPGMLRQIRDAVCPVQTMGPEASAAVGVLVQLGHARPDAQERVNAILAEEPTLQAADIIAQVCRVGVRDGKDRSCTTQRP